MTFPIPPAPVTWSKNQTIRAPQLRSDAANIAWLYTKRPLFLGLQVTTAQNVASGTPASISLDTTFLDNWLGHSPTNNANYVAPLSGWYLLQGSVTYVNGGVQTGFYSAGIHVVQNAVGSNLINSTGVPSTGGGVLTWTACDLAQLIFDKGDLATLLANHSQGALNGLSVPTFLKAEWIALPTTTYAGVSTPLGVVQAVPPTPALWPPGSGTTITNGGGITAGATSITVGSAQGMVINGTLGLEYYEGNAVSSTAETVNITSIVGTTIGISATTYAHAQNAYVSIPVSAAFLNNQVRDMVTFLAYPPIARLSNFGTAQSLAAQTFPAATAVTFQSATVDNFTGWGGVGTSTYTVQVSGVYFVYGQVALAAVATTCHAGISVAGGTVQWGDSIRTAASAVQTCPTVCKVLRVTASQTIQLMASSSTGVALQGGNSAFYSTLIVIWRGL